MHPLDLPLTTFTAHDKSLFHKLKLTGKHSGWVGKLKPKAGLWPGGHVANYILTLLLV